MEKTTEEKMILGIDVTTCCCRFVYGPCPYCKNNK